MKSNLGRNRLLHVLGSRTLQSNGVWGVGALPNQRLMGLVFIMTASMCEILRLVEPAGPVLCKILRLVESDGRFRDATALPIVKSRTKGGGWATESANALIALPPDAEGAPEERRKELRAELGSVIPVVRREDPPHGLGRGLKRGDCGGWQRSRPDRNRSR